MRYYPHYFFFPSCYSYYYGLPHFFRISFALLSHFFRNFLFYQFDNYHNYR